MYPQVLIEDTILSSRLKDAKEHPLPNWFVEAVEKQKLKLWASSQILPIQSLVTFEK